jgi:hypothetical protein
MQLMYGFTRTVIFPGSGHAHVSCDICEAGSQRSIKADDHQVGEPLITFWIFTIAWL